MIFLSFSYFQQTCKIVYAIYLFESWNLFYPFPSERYFRQTRLNRLVMLVRPHAADKTWTRKFVYESQKVMFYEFLIHTHKKIIYLYFHKCIYVSVKSFTFESRVRLPYFVTSHETGSSLPLPHHPAETLLWGRSASHVLCAHMCIQLYMLTCTHVYGCVYV